MKHHVTMQFSRCLLFSALIFLLISSVYEPEIPPHALSCVSAAPVTLLDDPIREITVSHQAEQKISDAAAAGNVESDFSHIIFNILHYGARRNDSSFDSGNVLRNLVKKCELLRHSRSTEDTSLEEVRSRTTTGLHFVPLYCTIYIPEGTYHITPFNVTSHMTLALHPQAVLLASQDLSTFPLVDILPSFGRGREHDNNRRYSAVISGYEVRNFTLETVWQDPSLHTLDSVSQGSERSSLHKKHPTGGATIDARGEIWWKLKKENKLSHTRGRMIEFLHSDHVTIRHVTLKNSPFWTIHPVYTNNLLIEKIRIVNPSTSPNTDGIDPNSCQNVTIRYNIISAGDDNISIKSGWDDTGMLYARPSRNISIHHNTFFLGDGVAIGSEMSGGVENVHIHHNTYTSTVNAVRLKTGYSRGGYIRNITWEHENLDGVATAVFFNMHYGSLPETRNETLIPRIYDITLRHIYGICVHAGHFACLPGKTGSCEVALMKDIHLSTASGWECENVKILHSEDVEPEVCGGGET